MAGDMNSRTVGGLLAYCDWLLEKGYAGASQVGPWKIAIRKVFESVDGAQFEEVAMNGLDLDDAFRRFRMLTAQTYKSESQDAYTSRVRRAIEAYDYWLANDRPPVFRQVSKKAGDVDLSRARKETTGAKSPDQLVVAVENPDEEFIEYPFPLRNGNTARLSLPRRLEKTDVDRMVQLLHALQYEPQAQIPERTGATSRLASS